MASNTHSFDLAWFGPNLQGQNAYLDAHLRSVTVWASGPDYATWNLTFTFSTLIGRISYVQVVLRPNEMCFRPVLYGSVWDLADPQGLTTVQFRGAENPYSTSTARPILTANFMAPRTMRSTISRMTSVIPGYRLRQDNKGSDGWTYFIVQACDSSRMERLAPTQCSISTTQFRQFAIRRGLCPKPSPSLPLLAPRFSSFYKDTSSRLWRTANFSWSTLFRMILPVAASTHIII